MGTDLFGALVISRALVRSTYAAVLLLLVGRVLRRRCVGRTAFLVVTLATQKQGHPGLVRTYGKGAPCVGYSSEG